MTALMQRVKVAGERLKTSARRIGGDIGFDPAIALSRDVSPERPCRLIKAADGWIAVNLAREEDRKTVPAWIGCTLEQRALNLHRSCQAKSIHRAQPGVSTMLESKARGPHLAHLKQDAEPWAAIKDMARDICCGDLLDQAVLLGMPVAVVGEALSSPASKMETRERPFKTARRSTVVDMSALWAGPYCGGLLAEAGFCVTKVEGSARPDPTPLSSPALDQRLNGRKKRISLNLSSPDLISLISGADILITSARPHALTRLGLSEQRLFALNPSMIWVAITAYGWTGEAAMRVGFGDDCAAAGGLIAWRDGVPEFIGDALADPLTGLTAATLAMDAIADGRGGLIDVPLAPTSAKFAW